MVLASAGWAFSIDSAEVSSSMPPPTWKLASEMLKNSRICRPMMAQVAITAKALIDEIRMVRRRCAEVKPCV
ncbi:hypothetical protein Y695_03470 [Hydrogenophaga sp. T4]|nr:hypothetical protein Y695_03470 [Hydrogenophaga sp. T4]